ncbi:MAG: orotidine-5'-phosphate decarboxylase, partial [bacterium]|nr:orotidine-5'-phosphate decarboxylase [bacterium]
MPNPFSERLTNACIERKSFLVVGLDPRLNMLPEELITKSRTLFGNTLEGAAHAIWQFNRHLIDSLADIVPAVKPQVAFYEQLGLHGMKAFYDTVAYAKSKGLLVIVDAKRNDIGPVATCYAEAFLGEVELWNGEKATPCGADALTINPFLGGDSIKPFIDTAHIYGAGLFILVKTSNMGGKDLQDLNTASGKLYERVGSLVDIWGNEDRDARGYSSVGAVVGATFPKEANRLRSIMKNSIFLVPGFGAQGAGAEDVVPCFNTDGLGAIVNSSRDVIFAFHKTSAPFGNAARSKAR